MAVWHGVYIAHISVFRVRSITTPVSVSLPHFIVQRVASTAFHYYIEAGFIN